MRMMIVCVCVCVCVCACARACTCTNVVAVLYFAASRYKARIEQLASRSTGTACMMIEYTGVSTESCRGVRNLHARQPSRAWWRQCTHTLASHLAKHGVHHVVLFLFPGRPCSHGPATHTEVLAHVSACTSLSWLL